MARFVQQFYKCKPIGAVEAEQLLLYRLEEYADRKFLTYTVSNCKFAMVAGKMDRLILPLCQATPRVRSYRLYQVALRSWKSSLNAVS